MASTSELLDRFVVLFNEGRFEETEQDFAQGGIGEEIGTNRRLTPREAAQNAQDWKRAFPDAHGTITTKVVEGNRGAAEIVWRGTHRGALMGHPPTHKPITVRAVVVIESDGNRITRAAHYLDVAGMLAQLGMMPGAQPTA